jgi:hypothetical protein
MRVNSNFRREQVCPGWQGQIVFVFIALVLVYVQMLLQMVEFNEAIPFAVMIPENITDYVISRNDCLILFRTKFREGKPVFLLRLLPPGPRLFFFKLPCAQPFRESYLMY